MYTVPELSIGNTHITHICVCVCVCVCLCVCVCVCVSFLDIYMTETTIARFRFGPVSFPTWREDIANATGWRHVGVDMEPNLSEGKPTRMRRLCLKTSEAEGRGGLGITSSEEVYELML